MSAIMVGSWVAGQSPGPGGGTRRPFRSLHSLGGAIPLLLLSLGGALAQGQDSVTSPMGPQTTAHPPPLLSSISAVTVPSGPSVQPLPVPVAVPKERGGGLVLPGMVELTRPTRLSCEEIADRNARTRCERLPGPPAPPAGATP
ncbi:hypothetical protein [Roseomonas chloroacetimidivorans]|uniref:hypothetical protein n=1 Tax=Roseomonas chloroacetimidivorans TaxID=1766656 RepID=UPI003C71A98A